MIGLFTHGLLYDDCSQLDTAKRINAKTKKKNNQKANDKSEASNPIDKIG